MDTFLNPDFFLENETARRLFHDYADAQPIFDYHCHLPPDEIAENKTFGNLTEIWLNGDHYKWRALRANGVEESCITGDAAPYAKHEKWLETLPYCLRNPLYVWSHLELRRYFDIDLPAHPKNAKTIWDQANAKLPNLTTHQILDKFNVAFVGTTDDPADSLHHHVQINTQNLKTKVVPTYRPDKALLVDQPQSFNAWLDKLQTQTTVDITTFETLLEALKARHDDFAALGCRASDHGLSYAYPHPATAEEAEQIFQRARSGHAASPDQKAHFAALVMRHVAAWNHARGWVMQLHLGPVRDANSRAFDQIGPDSGFDSIGDTQQGPALRAFLDQLNADGILPKTILYNVNPNDNELFATMAGNFPSPGQINRVQHGAAWWYLDQKDGIERQLVSLSNCGLLRRFVGMVTDSRSWLSYPRHEYFRRVLCNMVGKDVENGALPRDFDLLGAMFQEICFTNAREYFSVTLDPEYM